MPAPPRLLRPPRLCCPDRLATRPGYWIPLKYHRGGAGLRTGVAAKRGARTRMLEGGLKRTEEEEDRGGGGEGSIRMIGEGEVRGG
eukprot:774317-Pyramimonas_sp.AAC.1